MPKYTIDLNKPILDLSDDADAVDGMKATPEKLNKTLASLLRSSTEGDAIKHLDWAIDLHRTGKLEVDESDFQYLETFVKNSKNAWALVKGQILKAFIAAKDAAKEAAKATAT